MTNDEPVITNGASNAIITAGLVLLIVLACTAFVVAHRSNEKSCAINGVGTKLCGADALTYCDLIYGAHSERAGTRNVCAELQAKCSRLLCRERGRVTRNLGTESE